MTAVVRVKRRIDEEPLGAFVLNGKKRRLDDEEDEATTSGVGTVANGSAAEGKDEISTILKFAGTMQSQDDGAISQLARLTKDEAQQLVQQKSRKPTNHTERARQEMRQSLHENRFRVVNCLRTTLDAVDDSLGATAVSGGGEPKEITIVDIEKQHAAAMPAPDENATTTANTSSTTPAANVDLSQPNDSDTGYVYDLYLPENEQQASYVDLMDDNYLSVHAFDDLVYEDRFNNYDDDEYDSEDSNQENHIGNDYPEEEEDDDDDKHDDNEDKGTRQMRQAVEKFVFADDEDEESDGFQESSSDDEDCVVYSDPYVYSVDVDQEERFVDDVDFCDVDRFGMAYARYKARVLKPCGSKEDDDEEDDHEDDGVDGKENAEDTDERYHSASENEAGYD